MGQTRLLTLLTRSRVKRMAKARDLTDKPFGRLIARWPVKNLRLVCTEIVQEPELVC